ncbi:MAG: SDR family NAD(P)-dependent oxidoreductase [Candidatus Poribacteria bacterium]
MNIKNSIAIVTGSARGIGRKIAEALLSQGAYVALVDILSEQLEKTSKELSQFSEKILPIVCDITQPDQVDKMAEKVNNEFGSIDILINNAGTFSYIGPVWEADIDRWFRDIKVNLFGSFLVCRAVTRIMVKKKSGYVINIVSSGGVGDPHPYSTSYACSKTGLMRLTEGLSKETEKYNIKVFAVAPPAVLTEMTKFIMDDEGGKKWRPGFNKIFEQGHDYPPEKVAEFIIKLLSGKADKLTGRYFPVTQNFDEIIAKADEIINKDLLTLRIRY